jgi:hypothetical protein
MDDRSILDLIDDPKAFGPWFRDPATWAAWRSFLAALFGLDMDKASLKVYRACTGRRTPPKGSVTEAWLVVGRRGGKSFVLALVAVFLACFRDWRSHLVSGERGVVMVIATDRKQAGVIFSYVKALITEVDMLAALLDGEPKAEAINLTNRISIEIHTCSYRSVRGRTAIGVLLDESAFWRSDDAAEPDHEVLNALRPAMATIPGAMLLVASSPYSKRGILHTAWQKHFGKKRSPVLVWQADTRTMNPSVPDSLIKAAYEEDPIAAAAEYGAQFRSDVEALVTREAVEACTIPGRRELLPAEGIQYVGFVDPSGGSADSMTLAVAHLDGKTAVLDAVRERRPPFSPKQVAEEFVLLLKSYRLASVTGDRYGGEWPRERFRDHGIHYQLANKSKNDLYLNLLPMLNGGTCELLDEPRLLAQLVGLERRTSRAGKDTIDHGPGGHDDVANAVAGALVALDRPSIWPSITVLTARGLLGRRKAAGEAVSEAEEAAAVREDLEQAARENSQGLSVRPRGLSYFTGGDLGDWIRGR